MAKDRLSDTFNYFEPIVRTGQLAPLYADDWRLFRGLVEGDDRTNNGLALSLDLSWYQMIGTNENKRHALRAYLLASIYSGDVTAGAARAEAMRVRDRPIADLHREAARRIVQALGKDHSAVLLKVKAKGAGRARATADAKLCGWKVEREMESQFRKRGNRGVAVVLIDMQFDSPAQGRQFGGKSSLQHQQAVLKKAGELRMVIYDIVIDSDDASAAQAADFDFRRQRRASYADGAGKKTIAAVRDHFGLAQVRHIPKPSHPTFRGTHFREHLQADGIEVAVVMGQDANQCCKATVFGVPATLAKRPKAGVQQPSPQAVADWWRQNRRGEPCSDAAGRLAMGAFEEVDEPYVSGLLDHDIKVVTSRAVLVSAGTLEPEWGILSQL